MGNLWRLVGVLLLATPLAAQDGLVEEEAPEAIFDQKIGDVGVVLDMDGTWTTRLAAGWGQGYSPQGTLEGLGYPGYEKGVVFSQVPDFSLTLRLLERYYLEVIYAGTVEDRSFLVGYDGRPGEFVQWVKAGNASFSIPDRAGQSLAAGRAGAPAAAAAFTAGPVSLEFLARYEDGTRETKTFRGYQEESGTTRALTEWIRGRFFRLPGTGPFQQVRVLAADPEGTLGTGPGFYREATDAEAAVNPVTGEIQLAASATKTFLISWSGAAAYVGQNTPLLATAFQQDSSVASGPWLVLVQPGVPSPFEQRDRYPVARGIDGAILLVDSASGLPVGGYTISQAATQDWFQVSGPDGTALGEAPFWDAEGGRLRGLYPVTTGGTPPATSTALPWRFQLPLSTTATSYSLGPDVLASSLVVIRNGLTTQAFRFDAATGVLRLDVPVYETDTVVVSFQRSSSENKASDLVLWQGGRWDLDRSQNLEWNLQGRWSMDQEGYTTEDLQSPGRMALSVAYQGAAREWTWSVEATGGALLADSTGHRRLYSQNRSGTEATLDGDALRPPAAPRIAIITPDNGGTPSPALTDLNRGATYFRDYWSYDPLTGTPTVSAWGKDGVQREANGEGGWTGPYLVRGDGERTDRLAVAEADLEPDQWAGVQMFLDQGKPVDLSQTSAISVVVRLVGATSQTAATTSDRVYLQAGTLAEDLDGTATPRGVEYRDHPSLAFFDQTRGVKQYFPIPEGSSWGNDADRDGVAGEDGTLVSLDLAGMAQTVFDPTSTAWQTIRFVLTDEQRQRLQRTSGWRMVMVNDSLGSVTRQLLVGPVVFEGATWSLKADPGASGSVNPVEQEDSSRTDAHRLRIDWSGRDSWTLEGRHSPVRPASYQTLAFQYQYTPDGTNTADPVFEVTLQDADGRGLSASWTAPATSGWVPVRIDLRSKTMTVAGVKTGTVAVRSGAAAWDRMTLAKGGSGSGSGVWLVSEVEAVDPLWEPVGTSKLRAQWKQAEPWPSAQWPLVSGLSWGVSSTQSGLTSDDLAWQGESTLAGSLGPVRASGELSMVQTAQEQTAHGAYEATLPLGWPGGPTVEWTDRFSDRGYRSERVVIGVPWAGTWDLTAKTEGPPVNLQQTYRLDWLSPGQWPPGWSGSFSTQWTQSTPDAPTLEDFGQQWLQSWDWLLPIPSIAPYQLLQAQAGTKLTWAPWGVDTQTTARVAQSVGPAIQWVPAGTWTIKTPVVFEGSQAWSVTPFVSKKVESVYHHDEAVAAGVSASQTLDWLWAQPLALGSLPFEEQWTDTSPWRYRDEGLQSGSVQSLVGLDWNRTAASDWTDLVLPITGGTEVVTTRGRSALAEYRTTTVDVNLQARGLNLFGALGNHPVFSWYRTDVWTWSATGLWGTGTRSQDQRADASLASRAELILTPEESVALPVTYEGHWGTVASQALGLRPTWSLRHPASLPFDLPRWLSPSGFRRQWIQDLSTAVNFQWAPTSEPVLRNLEVIWKGRFLLSDKSELSFTTKWGQQWQTDLVVVGLEASVDLVLSF